MNIRDLHDHDFEGPEPPSADLLAGEYVLGVLDATQRRTVEQRIEHDPGFARLVADWERRLAPLLAEYGVSEVPPHLWPRIRSRLGWPAIDGAPAAAPPRAGLWQNAGFWRAATGLAAAAAIVALVAGPLGLLRDRGTDVQPPVAVEPGPTTPQPEPAGAPKPVSTLARDDGRPGWLASVDPAKGTVLMVPVPSPADPQGREPELWLIAPGEKPKSLGIVSIDRSHTVKVPDALRPDLVSGAVLAVTLEPKGGAPEGIATGPIVAKGDVVMLAP